MSQNYDKRAREAIALQIKNLSAAQVQTFGEILSANPEQLPPSVDRWQIHPGDMVKEMRTDDPVVLDYVSGMPLLVIYEGDMQSVYYLDRVLMLRPGIRFSIAALGNGCEISCRTHQPGRLQLLACHPAEEFSGAASELKLEQLYTFFYQECASDFYFRGEQHEAFELVYVDRGELHNLAGGADILLQQQQLMLIGQNVWHMQYADLPVSFLTVSFRAAVLPCSQLTGRAITLSARQISLVQQMLNAHNAESYAYDCVESLLKLLLADMLRNTDKQLPVCSAQRLPATSHAEQCIVDKLIQIVSARAGEKLSLQALADEAHISTTYLHRLFRSQLGMTPGTYIAKIRAEESKLLLRSGTLSMGEIAKKLGFSSQQHFSRQFRTVTGMTPSEYVRSLR